jgi:hypothetical protein
LPRTPEEWAAAKRAASEQRKAKRPAPQPRPPLPPDEQRDRRIKALTTANQNLRVKVRHLEQHFEDAIAKAGGMSFKTQSAIAKALHPDVSPADREAARPNAYKLFNAWKADKDKAGRRSGRDT